MNRDEILARLRELKPWLATKGVCRVRLFGSHARNAGGPNSDIDLLVELDRPMGLAFFGVEADLSEAMGVPVDLHTERSLHHTVLQRAQAEAIDA